MHNVGVAGMAKDAATLARVKRSGLGVLAPASGLQALSAVMASSAGGGVSTFAAAPVFWKILLRGGKQAPPFFSEFDPARLEATAKPHRQVGMWTSLQGCWMLKSCMLCVGEPLLHVPTVKLQFGCENVSKGLV